MVVDGLPVVILTGYKNPVGKFIGHFDGETVYDLAMFETEEKK
jgi:hypothetical protein